MGGAWAATLAAVIRGLMQAWLAVREAAGRGRAEERAAANARATEAERRAAGVPERTPEQIVRDLDGGGF